MKYSTPGWCALVIGFAFAGAADMKERLLAAGIDARASNPAEFQDRIARDITRWSEVVKTARIAVE